MMVVSVWVVNGLKGITPAAGERFVGGPLDEGGSHQSAADPCRLVRQVNEFGG
jgi:hypothetical protein